MKPMFSNNKLPLAGITVLSLAEQYPGPLCTRMLVEMGAEVIQLERPSGGDPQRDANPWLFRSTAINKKSVALDLKKADALEAARLLARSAHVLVEGFRPGVMQRLGLGYEALHALNPALVYCSISGFGQDGPYRDIVGHNINYEAISGLLDPYVEHDSPYTFFPSGLPLGDILGGYTAALAIVAALRSVDQGEPGTHLDISIADTVVFAMAPILTNKLNGGEGWPVREAGYGVFRTLDGHIALGVNHEDEFWVALCNTLGLEDVAALARVTRIERRQELKERLQERLAGRTTTDWLACFAELKVPCCRVNRLDEVPGNAQIRARGLITTATDENAREFVTVCSPFSRSQAGAASNKVPGLGESTEAILRTLGRLDGALASQAT